MIKSIPQATSGPALAALALMIAGCGSGSATATPRAANSGGAPQVVMKVLEFTPTTVEARVGQTVEWTNDDSSPHNVTYMSGPRFRSSRTIPPGAKFSIRVTVPGTIHYFCSLHPWMRATIVVSPWPALAFMPRGSGWLHEWLKRQALRDG